MRLFLGIWPSPTAVRALFEVQEGLRSNAPRGSLRFPVRDQLHLTLRFLGETDPARTTDLVSGLRSVGGRTEPFQLRLGEVGAFPDASRARVIWVGARGDLEKLESLQTAASAASDSFAQRPDEKRFHPHFTLARVRDRPWAHQARPRVSFAPRGAREREERAHGATRLSLREAILGQALPNTEPWTVESFRLVFSELHSEGSRYSTLAEIPFVTTR